MHWVKATAPDGRAQYVNLGSAVSMMPAADGTLVFLGGIAAVKDAKGADRFQFALTTTKESPDELFALPRIDVNVTPAAKPAGETKAKKPRKKKAAKA